MAIRRNLILFIATSLAFAALAHAQKTEAHTDSTTAIAQAAPAFDVISIKPAKAGAIGTDTDFSNGTFTARNVTLGKIIQYEAYGIPAPRILGIPPALDKVAFDIQAKVDPAEFEREEALPHDQQAELAQQIVRRLLADRFKLVVHTETRELPVYALVVTKSGSKLQPSQKPDSDSTRSRTGYLKAEGITMDRLANSLTGIPSAGLGRAVIDKTGLTGKFDLTLKWTPDTGSPPLINGMPDTSAPSIFTAIQEQLGLKLESTRAAVPVLVVDHAELPTQD